MSKGKPAVEHTPGPWHISGQHGEFVNDPREMNVCRVNATVSWSGAKSVSDGPMSHEANARLIAAGPAILEALEAAQQHMVGLAAYLATCNTDVIIENLETTIAALHKQERLAEAAIRLARGESQ